MSDAHAAIPFDQDELEQILRKYDRPGPRYTSYPTAPVWSDDWKPSDLNERLDALGGDFAGGSDKPLALYFHIPFCEERCLFCGCNVVISRKKRVAQPYLEYLKKEIDLYVERVGKGRRVIQMHLGGGTPTYFEPEQLEELMDHTKANFTITEQDEVSIEVDPVVTTRKHLETLRRVGFNRISMGQQDLDPKVQETVHRVQPTELTDQFIRWCRELEFESINIDLIYGLPYQDETSFKSTLDQIIAWRPDRVAVFNYAHVPWLKKHQKLLPEDEMPDPATKLAILAMTLAEFVGAGYESIGLDHFALPDDELSVARREEKLRRNFMGYTTKPESDILAFGVSSISEVAGAYSQNRTKLADYYRELDAGTNAAFRGMVLSEDDKIRRDVIMGVMNNLALDYATIEERYGIDFKEYFAKELTQLNELADDGLIELGESRIQVTAQGQMLVRNVAMVFDAYLKASSGEEGAPRFSRTV